jgi:hypothetical protein
VQEAGERKYSIVIEVRPLGSAEDLLKAFRLQSALEADHKKPATAAQFRRSRADADLLEELLRSRAIMTPTSSRAPSRPATRCG